MTLRLGGGVNELKELELAYAPPYSSVKDPVNMAGFVAENVLRGAVRLSAWDAVEREPDAVLLDVREEAELMAFRLPPAKHIPLGQLRGRLSELDKSKRIITFCAIGVRSYNAARILMQHGFSDVLLYPGGTRFYQSPHYEQTAMAGIEQTPVADSGAVESSAAESSVVPAASICPGCMERPVPHA